MSKVIILSDRNTSLKYDKKLLFKSRLQINSSRKKNIASLSITNNQSNTNKNSSFIKDYQKHSQKKQQLKPYNHKKNITYINGNHSIFNDIKSISKKYININNYNNSTFNNFAKNIKHDLNNIITKDRDNYYSNKTFLKKNLNNSVIGKPIVREKQYQNFEKIRKHKKNIDFRVKKILSLSNSLTKSSKVKNEQIYKKESIKKNFYKNILIINKKNNNINHISYNNSLINTNYPKLPNKEFKNHKKNSSKRNNKGIYSSFNSFHNKKHVYGRSEENKKNKNYNLNNVNKIKLKKYNINISKNKMNKYNINNKRVNKYNNNNKKIIRNMFQLSCKEINKTEINSVKKNKEKPKRKKEKKEKKDNNSNNIDIIKNNLNENDYREEIINDFNEKDEIKVNKLEDTYYLSEISKKFKIINYDSENALNEEEKEEDSKILSLEEVQDIIKYYDFDEINLQDNYLFYPKDYSLFINYKKELLINDFFKGLYSPNLIKTKIKQKNTLKKKVDKNKKVYNISSPIHIVNFDNRKYKTFKK